MKVHGDSSWKLIFLCQKYSFNLSGYSMSKTWTRDLNPRSVIYVCIFACALAISVCDLLFISSAIIVLLSLLYQTITYLFSLLDVTVKQPVWLLTKLPLTSITFKVTKFSQTSSSGGDIVMTFDSDGLVLGLFGLCFCVLHICWRVCRRCPFMVATNFGRCFSTSFVVRPGH